MVVPFSRFRSSRPNPRSPGRGGFLCVPDRIHVRFLMTRHTPSFIKRQVRAIRQPLIILSCSDVRPLTRRFTTRTSLFLRWSPLIPKPLVNCRIRRLRASPVVVRFTSWHVALTVRNIGVRITVDTDTFCMLTAQIPLRNHCLAPFN